MKKSIIITLITKFLILLNEDYKLFGNKIYALKTCYFYNIGLSNNNNNRNKLTKIFTSKIY